jgi:hypothetical protein
MADNGTPDLSRFFQFPIITDICIYLCNSLLFLLYLNLFSNSHLKMDTTLEKLKSTFPFCLRIRLQKFTVLGVQD